jgi:hypothetical protein
LALAWLVVAPHLLKWIDLVKRVCVYFGCFLQ